jgi:hypothetical protein
VRWWRLECGASVVRIFSSVANFRINRERGWASKRLSLKTEIICSILFALEGGEVGKSPDEFRAGDIIVTAVARHYAIGRVQADGVTQEYLASEPDRITALAHACRLAGTAHRVLLYRLTADTTFTPHNCRLIQAPGRKRRA